LPLNETIGLIDEIKEVSEDPETPVMTPARFK
jgi:hypothetical protein